MELSTAKEIAKLATTRNRKIDAIRLLRIDTSFGLLEAKHYLDRFTMEDVLLMQLCDDFVMDKQDLLIQAMYERDRIDERILHLQQEIAQNHVET